MTATPKPIVPRADARAVLSKAVAQAAERLAISRSALGRVLGLSPASISRLHNGAYLLDPARKEWEFGLLLVRAFRSLDSIVGDETTARKWLGSNNRSLGGRPIELIVSTEGLVRVVQYLDASRGIV